MDTEIQAIKEQMIQLLDADTLLSGLFDIRHDLKFAKFSRSRLLLKNAQNNQADLRKAKDAAVALELIHLASLVHDDVIDQADIRRQQNSVKADYGNHNAILFGDYLFSLAIQHIQNTQNIACARLFTQCVHAMCRGESIQDLVLQKTGYQAKLDDIFQAARGKTGALFAFCLAAPVHMLAEEKLTIDTENALREIGYLLGLAYQLVDDSLDILSHQHQLGKPSYQDLQENCLTTPLFMLMESQGLTDWQQFRLPYLNGQADLRIDFINAQILSCIKEQLTQIQQQIKIQQQHCHNWQIERLVEYFWHNFIMLRI